MSVLVSGGVGFIGSHTVVELLNAGYDVVVFDNFYNSKPCVIDRIKTITGKDFKFYNADMLNSAALDVIFEENDIDAVIHFAGYKAVGESVSQPLKYYHNNITGTLILLEEMAKHNVKTIVFSSSATVYGDPESVPMREDFPTSATNPYGQTKLMIEQILKDLTVSDTEWSASCLRYFNPIGAHKSGLIGEDPMGIPNNIMPRIQKVAAGEWDAITVYGTDYDTPDGTGVRDYIHVTDLAKAHIAALKRAKAVTGWETYNIGCGRGYSVYEIIDAYERASGTSINRVVTPRRPGDIAVSYADPTRAKEILGWEAELTLDDMCRDAYNFRIKNPRGYED
ncbi:MAG: UDP-glucose 4-epimerase GalE [Firmicutes bacterium]|nr:UDP-glucose 4-epimerase GalE [Bacillota bacterium]